MFSELQAVWQSLLVAQCGDKGGQKKLLKNKTENGTD